MALHMAPSRLQIADVVGTATEGHVAPNYPEIASLDPNLSISFQPMSARKKKTKWRSRSPPCNAAWFTGLYILAAGLTLLIAPVKTFGILFDSRSRPLATPLKYFNFSHRTFVYLSTHFVSSGFFRLKIHFLPGPTGFQPPRWDCSNFTVCGRLWGLMH